MAKQYDKVIITDGDAIKGIDLPQYGPSAWNWYTGEPDENVDSDEYSKFYYPRVSAVYRAANLNATIISSIPFAITNSNGDDVDRSDDWKNIVGFMPNPRDLLRLWRLSLFMTNSAYAFREGPSGYKLTSNLRYIVPTSVTPIVDARDGLTGFRRTVNNTTETYAISKDDWCRLFYMHWLDHTTEVTPSKNTEFVALMNAAGVLFHADSHVKNFFKRGGIKPTMLMLKGMTTPENREKIESLWTKIITGGYKFLGKIFQGVDTNGGIEPMTIGEGIDNLKDEGLHQQALEDVAMAAGMPLSLLLSNSANYATAQQEYSTWFNNEVVPRADWMAEIMNDQLFKPLGYKFEFRSEVTNEGTEEEEQRAGAIAALIASNFKPSAAAQMLGLELPPDYTDYSQLDEDYFWMMERKAAITAANNPTNQLAPDEPKISDPKPKIDKVNPDVAKPTNPSKSYSMSQFSEAKNWRDIAHRKFKRGEKLDFPFVAKELDEETASAIRANLAECKTEKDVETVFDLNNYADMPVKSDLLILAESLNKAADALMESRNAEED